GERIAFGPRKLASAALFYPVFYGLVVVQLAHTYFFEQALERRFSLLDLAPSSVLYLLDTVLPRAAAWGMVAALMALHGIAYVSLRKWGPVLERFAPRLLPSAAIATIAATVLGHPPASAFVDTYRDVRELSQQRLVHDAPQQPPASEFALLDKSGG